MPTLLSPAASTCGCRCSARRRGSGAVAGSLATGRALVSVARGRRRWWRRGAGRGRRRRRGRGGGAWPRCCSWPPRLAPSPRSGRTRSRTTRSPTSPPTAPRSRRSARSPPTRTSSPVARVVRRTTRWSGGSPVHQVTGRGRTLDLVAPVLVLGDADDARVPLGATVRLHGRLLPADDRDLAASAPAARRARGRRAARAVVAGCRRGPAGAPRLGGAPTRRPAGAGAGAGRRRRRRRSTRASRTRLPDDRADPPARGLRHQPDPGGRVPAGPGPLVPGARALAVRRGRGRDRRLRAARPHRAERAAGGGDGHGRPGRARHRRPAPGPARPRGRGRRPAAARPGAGGLGRLRAVRRWPPPASCCSPRPGATRWRAGCRAGWPRRSRCPAAAQLACTPVVAAISGQVSLVAVVANLLVAPGGRAGDRARAGGRGARAGRGRRSGGCAGRSRRGASPGSSRSPSTARRCRRRRSAGGPVPAALAVLTVLTVLVAVLAAAAAAPAGRPGSGAALLLVVAVLVRPPTSAGRPTAGCSSPATSVRVTRWCSTPGRAGRRRRRRTRPRGGGPLPGPARRRHGAAARAHPLPRRPRRRARRRARRPRGRRGRDHPAARPAGRGARGRRRRRRTRGCAAAPAPYARRPRSARSPCRCSGRRPTRRPRGPATARPPTTRAWCCSCEVAGLRILLTGDVEPEGQAALARLLPGPAGRRAQGAAPRQRPPGRALAALPRPGGGPGLGGRRQRLRPPGARGAATARAGRRRRAAAPTRTATSRSWPPTAGCGSVTAAGP